MYQVLFAEDEVLVRLGLQNAIPWERFHMELTAQCDNGEEAFALFQERHPDLVITDIRMEKMDGVELIRRIREIDRECAIVVLSCVDDFWMLKGLIPYKISGYIAKATMSMDEIFGVLEEVSQYLDGLGRRQEVSKAEEWNLETQLAEYFNGETEDDSEIPEQEELTELLLFRADEGKSEKLNDLTMKFVRDLIRQQIPQGVLIECREREVGVFLKEPIEKDGIECVLRSIEGYLGKHFLAVSVLRKRGGENLKSLYERAERSSENEWDMNSLIRSSIRYMHLHHQDTLGLSDIADVMGLSPGYFSHLFKKETGKNYVEYLNEIRLEEVKEDLRNSDDKIAVIAEKHGFNNQEYFSRFFKKSTGVSPAQWRRMYR